MENIVKLIDFNGVEAKYKVLLDLFINSTDTNARNFIVSLGTSLELYKHSSQLVDNPALKSLLGTFKKRLGEIDSALLTQTSATLPVFDRDVLLKEKEIINKYLSYFDVDALQQSLSNIEREIDIHLDHNKKLGIIN